MSGAPIGEAWFRGIRASGVVESIDLRAQSDRLRGGGFWVVVGDFEGRVRGWRFAAVEREEVRDDDADAGSLADGATLTAPRAEWVGPARSDWVSSMDAARYQDAVERIRAEIRAGEVYQVNLCRVLSAPLPAVDGAQPPAAALGAVLEAGNPAPYSGGIQVPGDDRVAPVWVVSASPELFVRLADGRVTSAPIKGTATVPSGLTSKDEAENVMITDLVRNDLQRVCEPGTVEVTHLLELQEHPGLVHLVSTVAGDLRAEVATGADPWGEILDALYPPASVSGAPKLAALRVIGELEPVPRGPYCGAFGWIDADANRAELAVAIRTFWWDPADGGRLNFGTGAGITWGSDAAAEWRETELKARRLISLASTEGWTS